jgi:putative nucleotidyltransferase with HDIG domain
MTHAAALPVLPAPHARALQLLEDRNAEIGDLAETVSADPALTTAVLRAANSAASAPINRVTEADQAIMRIGLDSTRRLVAGTVVGTTFKDIRKAGIDTDQLWDHLIACALLTDQASRSHPHIKGGFSAGMLHDLGRMAMAQAEPERYHQVVTLAHGGADARSIEIDVFGYDHQEFGQRIAEAWQLPDEIIEAVGDHHEGGRSDLARAVRDSRWLALRVGIGDGLCDASVFPEASLELRREEKLLLSAIGGEEALHNRVQWFRHAIASQSGQAAA